MKESRSKLRIEILVTGMTYRIVLTKEFIKDMKKLDSSMVSRVRKKIDEVALNPERFKHLHYSLAGSCRVRVGKVRITYSYDISRKEIYLEQVIFGHRY